MAIKELTEEEFLEKMKKILCVRGRNISLDESLPPYQGAWDSLSAVEYLDMVEESIGTEVDVDLNDLTEAKTVRDLWNYYHKLVEEY